MAEAWRRLGEDVTASTLLTSLINNQKVTWWRVTGGDGFGGDVIAAPVLIGGRWQEKAETFIGQIDRRELISSAVVFLLDQDVGVGDYLANGDQTLTSNPSILVGAYKIQHYQKSPDLRSLEYVRKCFL